MPFSYSGFDLCMLGALAASGALHAAGQNADRIDPDGVGIAGEVKQEVVEPTTRSSREPGDARHGSDADDDGDDDDRENLPERSRDDDDRLSHDLPVLREAQPLPEQSPLWSGSRLMELSKKDLNLLKLSSDKLYSFPTQVPPLNSLLYMDKPVSQ